MKHPGECLCLALLPPLPPRCFPWYARPHYSWDLASPRLGCSLHWCIASTARYPRDSCSHRPLHRHTGSPTPHFNIACPPLRARQFRPRHLHDISVFASMHQFPKSDSLPETLLTARGRRHTNSRSSGQRRSPHALDSPRIHRSTRTSLISPATDCLEAKTDRIDELIWARSSSMP